MTKEKPDHDDQDGDDVDLEEVQDSSGSKIRVTAESSPNEKTLLYDTADLTDDDESTANDPRKTKTFDEGAKTIEFDGEQSDSFSLTQSLDTPNAVDENLELGGDVDEDLELGGDIDENLELGAEIDDDLELGSEPESETDSEIMPNLPKTIVVDEGTLLSNEFDNSLDQSCELAELGISNDGWGKQNSSISKMSSMEAPLRAKRPMVQPKLNDRLVVADGERKLVGNPDYRVISFLGSGAMGEVFIACQTSVDRNVAFKKQIPKTYSSRRKKIRARNKFLFEAQITANLDHPNIVAIHDMGRDQNGDIFYCMELVRGEPWEDVISEMTLEENLEVLLKVIDGTAYAHSKNTIHRDLKPENTMLGSFGEVLIMDWGLGVNLDNGPPQSMGGTPAFMAPEMAQRDVELVGKHSDIYLLGAVLFMIITGEAPHIGEDAWKCLDNARDNNILDVSSLDRKIDKRLLAIALKAMSTRPEDRYANPEQLRTAIENYQSNLLSIRLTERSERELSSAIENGDYEYFSKSMFGFQEALSLWQKNAAADSGLQRSKVAYAECALERQDFELGMSLLDPNSADEAVLFQKLRKGADASQQRKRLVWLAIGSSLLLLTVLVVSSTLNARTQRLNAENLAAAVELEKKAKFEAEKATEAAEAEKRRAEEERGKAEAERNKADKAKKFAEKLAVAEEAERRRAEGLAVKEKSARETAEQLAVKEKLAREKAEDLRLKEIEARRTAERLTNEKEAQRLKATNLAGRLQISENSAKERLFQSNIGLIDSYIRDNQIEQAIEKLKRTRLDQSRFVDWEWNRLYHLCHTEVKSISLDGVTAIDQSENGQLSIVSSLGKAKFWNPSSSRTSNDLQVAGAKAICTAISRDGKWAAIGTADPKQKLTIWDTSSGQNVANFSDRIGASLVSCLAFNDSGTRLAVGDSSRIITLFDGNATNWTPSKKLGFHSRRPVDLDFSSEGQRLVSVSRAGLSIVWDTNSGKPISAYSHPSQLRAAKFVPDGKGLVACATNDREIVFWNSDLSNDPLLWQELSAEQLEDAKSRGFVESLVVHESAVNDLDFSGDGKTMMTCGDDRTIAVWNVKDQTLTKRFRGHVNAVLSCSVANEENAAVSASADGEVRVWRFDEYEDQRTFSPEKSLPLNFAQFNNDASELLTCGEDGAIRVWNCNKSTQLESKLEFDPKLGRRATYLPKSGRIVTSSPGNVFAWENGKLIHKVSEVGSPGIVVTSKNERLMVTGGDENHPTIVWDLETGDKVATLLDRGSRNRVTAMAISPDDRYLALGTGLVEGIVSVFDLRSFQIVDEFEQHRGWITDLVFSPSSNEFLSADSVEGYVNAWSIENDRVRREKKIMGIGGSYIRIAYSDSGTQFVTSTNTDTNKSELQVWDSQTKTPVTKVQLSRSIDFVSMIRDEVVFRLTNGKAYGWKHANGKRHMRHVPLFSNASYPTGLNGWSRIPGNRSLVYGDGFVKIIDSPESEVSRGSSIANVYDSAGNPGPCLSALFADDEKQIVALYQDGAIRFWDRKTDAVKNVILSPKSPATGIDIMPNDSRRLATCDSEGVIRCIDVQTNVVLIEIETGSKLNSVKWLGKNSVVVAGSTGLSVVDLNTEEITKIDNAPESLVGIDRSKAGSVLVGVGENRIYLWRRVDSAWQPPTIFGSQVLSARVSPNGKRVFSGDASGAITVWYIPEPGSSDDPRKMISLLGHEKEVSSIAQSADGSHVASSSRDGSAILWLSAEGKQQ
jgi:WD40 repeat protein/serine/threonine protein kinase/heme exporter protein D